MSHSFLWTDQRTLGHRQLDGLWRFYRDVSTACARFITRGHSLWTITTQEITADEEIAAQVAQRLTDTWFEDLGLEYHGIALGPLLRYKVGGYNAHLHGLCRHAYKAQALVDKYTPDRVVMVEPALLPAGAFLEVLAQRSKVPVSALLPRPFRPLGRQLINRLFYTIGYEKVEVPLLQAEPQLGLDVVEFPESVLFVASMSNYLNPMLPVMRALREREKQVVTLVPNAAREWANYTGLREASSIIFAEELLDEELRAEIKVKRKEYGRLFRKKQSLLRERLQLENGLDLWPFAGLGMRVVFEHLLPHTVGYIGLAERCLRYFNPWTVIIARQRRAFENAFVSVARREGVPTAMLIHGHVSAQPVYHFIDGRFDQMERIFAWGAEQKTTLVAKGASPERVAVTGNPQWDRMATGLDMLPGRDACRAEMAAALDLPSDEFWVTFTSQTNSRPFFPDILAAVRALPGAVLIVKVHPAEGIQDYPIPAADQMRCRIVKAVDLHTLLRASDVVLTYTSTTNLEALAVGTPLCVVDFVPNPEMPHRIELTAYGIPKAQNSEQLQELLSRLQEEDSDWRSELLKGGRRALEDYAHSLDGQATQRVMRALLALAGEAMH